MKTIAEIKQEIQQTERKIIALETRSFAILLNEVELDQLKTAQKVLPLLEKQLRLEELRKELRAERISIGELLELQSLKAHIEPGDVELLEAAGVPEELPSEDTYYIEYLNAAKRHARDRAEFASYEDAKAWGKANLENFNSDMIRIKR